jgi:Hypothetical glycosyl hydrolase family 15
VTSRFVRAARRQRATWRCLAGLCLVLLVTVAGCETRATPATGPGPASGADPRPYRRGVWLLLDPGENRHACHSGGVGRYRYIVVQWYMTRDHACPLERIKAANLDAKVLAYQNLGAMIAGPHTDGRPSTCVTQEDAAANDAATPGDAWRLHDTAGKVLAFHDEYAYLQPGNIGRATYQARCLHRLARIKADGYDGVLGDDVNVYPGHGLGEAGGTPLAEYPTDGSYGDAMVRALRRIGPDAARLGLPLIPNIGADLGTRAHRGRAMGIVRASSGLFTEFWTRWDGAGPGQGDAAWESVATIAQEVQALGKPFIASTYYGPGPHGPAADQQYAAASFWLVWDGRQDSGWGYDLPGDPAAGFSPAWGPDLGVPLDAARVRVGVGWRRRYSAGIVVVNPSRAASQRFELGAGFRKPDGLIAATVALPPMSGMVLATAATTPGGRR